MLFWVPKETCIRLLFPDQLYLIHRNKHRELGKMRRQRTMFRMIEQDKTLEKELHNVDISNLPEKVLKVMPIKMPTKVGRRATTGTTSTKRYKI